MPARKKYRPAKRIGFKPSTTNVDDHDDSEEEDIEGFDFKREKVKNPFKALGLKPDHVDYHANNPADRIYAWYMDGSSEELSPEDEWYHHVFKTAHTCQVKGDTDSKISKILQKYFGLSERLSYKYIYASQALFGNVAASDKKAMRHMLTQMARSCYARALKDGDVKAALLAIREMKTINGVDREDAWIPDSTELGGNTFMMQINIISENGQSETRTINLNSMDAGQQKLLTEAINQMDQVSEAQIMDLIEKSDQEDE